jgi:TPR repeat protein
LYRQAAELGLPEAQRKLALMYSEGSGVPKDNGEAQRWLTKASAEGVQNSREVAKSGGEIPISASTLGDAITGEAH